MLSQLVAPLIARVGVNRDRALQSSVGRDALNSEKTSLGFQAFASSFKQETLAALLSFFLGKKKEERLQ